MSQPRHTGRGIVVHEGKLLLMERWRPGKHYFSIPGGGIEDGETAQQAAQREIAEETSLEVTVGREVLQMHHGDIVHHIFLCEYVSGEPYMPSDAPEMQDGADNRFKPGWFAIENVPSMPFLYWQPIQQVLSSGLINGFANQVTIVSVEQTS